MLHELLLALQGCSGSIFIKSESQIKVIEGITFLHPCENSVLNKLCSLGTQYSFVADFICRHDNPQKGGGGLYLAALCRGLNVVLDGYRKKLLEIEKECIKDPHLPLSHFQYKLDEYQLLFPALANLIDTIEACQARGCYLLTFVYKCCSSGIPIAQDAFKRILQVCHGVMYKQLTAWLLYGILTDQYDEFFIRESPKNSENPSSDVPHTPKSSKMINEFSFHHTFELKSEMLPSYLPVSVATKILFVGEAIKLFSNKKDSKSKNIDGCSVLNNQESLFSKKLFCLQENEEFSVSQFECVIDEIRSCVAHHLWKLVVVESDLISKLMSLKNYFLLARGELYLAFIDQVGLQLSIPPTATTEHDVNVTFQMAARSVIIDESSDVDIEKFHLKINQPENLCDGEVTIRRRAETGWMCLGLTYDVSWPLHILFTPSVLSRYELVFKFLLLVKRVQSELHKCWTLQMVDKSGTSNHTSAWQLRNHMSFMVDNLQYYLQADVLESQFSSLIEKVKSIHDFEQIQCAHESFLTSILAQTFLLMKPVSQSLHEILNLCLKYCKLMNGSPVDEWTSRDKSQRQLIRQEFSNQTSLLFKILSSVSSLQSSPYLAQFLLRIDYNKYLSNVGGQLGTF